MLYTNTPREKPTEMTMEEKLAFLDSGRKVDKNDLKLVRIRFLLSELSKKWNEPVSEIAGNTNKAQLLLKEKCVNESCLIILEEMNKVVNASLLYFKILNT